ncbi:uncharacterized protein RJT20DRAFT_11665 [Scheffersomyces xylosifermentans]|uniref:uncharacterized protein n=1 Tax=Scheffersomyces xylosifermentans TaxID=1304137 RepID=UPI00315CFAA7
MLTGDSSSSLISSIPIAATASIAVSMTSAPSSGQAAPACLSGSANSAHSPQNLAPISQAIPLGVKHPILNLTLSTCSSPERHFVPSSDEEHSISSTLSTCSSCSSNDSLSPPLPIIGSGLKLTKRIIQPRNSILKKLPASILADTLQYVDQYDLLNLSLTCSTLNHLAVNRLYKRVTVILNGEFPRRYKDNAHQYISENGLKYMDSSIILNLESLIKFLTSLHTNPELIQKIKFFVFDKCYKVDQVDINLIQSKIIEFFGSNSTEINFLHITFIDFITGIIKLTDFLKNSNVRNKIFKLFVTKTEDLYEPNIPQSLINLFLMLNEVELMEKDFVFDLSKQPYDVFNSLFTLTCSTNNQVGLEILKKIKLYQKDMKLKLKGLTIFHCHKENFSDENDLFNDYSSNNMRSGEDGDHFNQYMNQISKKLDFFSIHEKIDIMNLTHLYLKVDCNEHRHNHCNCFESFFKNFTEFSVQNGGLPNLINFEVESFPNLDWLRPHQILENILTPLGGFIKTLTSLSRLTIDFSTPGFKMFDNNMGMSTWLLNKLNERLMEAFFLCFFTSSNKSNMVTNLKTLQLPDFLTSFIYYKPDFYESLLHTCPCWGCQLVLEQLCHSFYPINSESINDNTDDEEEENATLDLESTYYMLIGYILGKLQADREVCIPIKEKTFNYGKYPIYKGQPHTLHNGFHKGEDADDDEEECTKCSCSIKQDPMGKSRMNIDNLVTTYIVHQLDPIIQYLSNIFLNLDNLMIHGIYYEYDTKLDRLAPIYDDYEYPADFLAEKQDEIDRGIKPSGPFGYFRN